MSIMNHMVKKANFHKFKVTHYIKKKKSTILIFLVGGEKYEAISKSVEQWKVFEIYA